MSKFKKTEDDKIIYSARIKSLSGDSRIELEPNEKKSFQGIVVSNNGEDYHLKLNSYFKDFDFLRDVDKDLVLRNIEIALKNKDIEIKANVYNKCHNGQISVINRVSNGTERVSFDHYIKEEVAYILRTESVNVNATVMVFNNPNDILLDYNGTLKSFRLDLYGTSAEKLNKLERYNLNSYLNTLIESGSSVSINLTGATKDSWFGELTVDHNGRKINIGTRLKDILDVTPERYRDNDVISYNALVSSVIDGDTVKIYKNGERHNLRLAAIDSPEKSQAFGTDAKIFLEGLIPSKVINVRTSGEGVYKRKISFISALNDNVMLDLNKAMVGAGLAYSVPEGNSQPYKKDEDAAKKRSNGLWASLPVSAERPSEYRKKNSFNKK